MKNTHKYLLAFLCFIIAWTSFFSSTYANDYSVTVGYGVYNWSTEGENNLQVCNWTNKVYRPLHRSGGISYLQCQSTTFRIDKTAPTLSTSWLQPEVTFDTTLQITATDNALMTGGSLVVTQDNDKFDVNPVIILQKTGVVTLNVKPEFMGDIFTTNLHVVAKDGFGYTTTADYVLNYDGQAPIIDIQVQQNNQSSIPKSTLLEKIASVFFNTAFAEEKTRIGDSAIEPEITDNYGFLVNFSERVSELKQSGIDEILYRYQANDNFFPVEFDGIPETTINTILQKNSINAIQANVLFEKYYPEDTGVHFIPRFKRELEETMTRLNFSETQKNAIRDLWNSIWKTAYYTVPSTNQSLTPIAPKRDTKLDAYFMLPASGNILLEIQAVDKAGNIANELFNIHLDTKPLAQVYPQTWVNLSKDENITLEVLDKYDTNKYFTKDTYIYKVKKYNNDGSIGDIVWQTETENKNIVLDKNKLNNASKGKYLVEISYKNPLNLYESAKFTSNIYIDNSDIKKPENISPTLQVPTEIVAGILPTVPKAHACTSASTIQTGKTNFLKCIPDLNIPKSTDNIGRADIISYPIKQIANASGGKMEEFNFLVFDTHRTENADTIEQSQETNETLLNNVKQSVSNKAKINYEEDILSPLFQSLITNDLNGSSIFGDKVDPNESQKSMIQASLDRGTTSINDPQGVKTVNGNDVTKISFSNNDSEKQYQKILVYIENLYKGTDKMKLEIKKKDTEIEFLDGLLGSAKAANTALNEKILNLTQSTQEKKQAFNVIKAQIIKMEEQLGQYSHLEDSIKTTQAELDWHAKNKKAEIQKLRDTRNSLPAIIQSMEIDRNSKIAYKEYTLVQTIEYIKQKEKNAITKKRDDIYAYNSCMALACVQSTSNNNSCDTAKVTQCKNLSGANLTLESSEQNALTFIAQDEKNNNSVAFDTWFSANRNYLLKNDLGDIIKQIADINVEIEKIQKDIDEQKAYLTTLNNLEKNTEAALQVREDMLNQTLQDLINSRPIKAQLERDLAPMRTNRQQLVDEMNELEKQMTLLERDLVKQTNMKGMTEYVKLRQNLNKEKADAEALIDRNEILISKNKARLFDFGKQIGKSEDTIQKDIDTIEKKFQSQKVSFVPQSNTSLLSQFVDTVLGIQTTYAVALDEGVYSLPDGSTIIVDLTAPTGSISGYKNGGNATIVNEGAVDERVYKSAQDLKLGLIKNDNFESYGSFKSWTIKGRKGTHNKTGGACSFTGGYTTTVTTGVNYGDEVANEGNVVATNTWGDCFQYQLILEDQSGNTSTGETKEIYADGILPKLVSATIEDSSGNSVDNETADQKTCSDCDLESAWSTKPLTLNWSFIDDESGIQTVQVSVLYNGNVISSTTDLTGSNSYTTPADKEGVYVISLIATDLAGNTIEKKYTLKYDKTSPTLSWNNTATGGNGDSQLAGSGLWTFGFDDLGNANSSSSTNKDYVAQITKEDIAMSFYKCTSDDCSTSELLTKATGNTVDPENSNWVDVVSAMNWSNKDAQNTLENQEIIFKHSKFYNDGTGAWEQGGGKYKIIYTLKDRAGNESSLEKVLTVEPNQMSAANSNVVVNSSCSDGSWKANGNDTCYISVTGKDMYGNPLYGKTVQMQGFSQTPIDRVHNNDLVYNSSDLTQRNSQESIYFESVKNAAAGVQTNTNFTLDNDGLIKINLVAFAPEETGKQIDFYAQYKEHTSSNYPEGSGDYSNVKTVTGSNYKSITQYSFSWVETPAFFSKNATQSLIANISNLIGANAENERLGLYIYDALTGAYSVDNMNSLPTEAKNTWVFGAENPTAGNLGVVNTSYDAGVIDSALSDNNSGIYTYKVQMTKKAGVQDFDTTVTIAPFVRMTVQGKEVAYPLIDKLVSNIPLYNQATQTSGSGLVQNNTGNTSQSSGEEAASTANSGISVLAVTANVKENVKKEILNLTTASSDGTIVAGNDKNGLKASGGVSVINNGNTYIIRGDDKNLVISEDITVGSNPIAFVTYGGNIIIRGNIRYAGAVKPTIAIIALQNETTGKGGTIQVANETNSGVAITNILGTLIAERGTIGLGTNASGTETVNLTGEERGNSLTNQLVIDGSIMGGNTLGGGDAPYKCPTFIRVSSCNEDVAQKYDLNYLRRYVPGQTDTHKSSENNNGTTQPVLIRYYLNRELLPEELQ